MKKLSLLVLAAASLFAAGCGSAHAGDSCDKTGFLCDDASTALECRVGVWTRLPCRGPGGCTKTGDTVKCDMTANQAGDACASTAEGKGLCTQSGNATLECRQGVLVQTNTCTTCTTSGDQIYCQM